MLLRATHVHTNACKTKLRLLYGLEHVRNVVAHATESCHDALEIGSHLQGHFPSAWLDSKFWACTQEPAYNQNLIIVAWKILPVVT